MLNDRDTNDERPVHVITGATGGVGSELCGRLLEGGARVAMVARDEGRVTALAERLGGRAFVAEGTSPESLGRCFHEIKEHYGRIDGTANCIGSLLLKPAHLTTDAEWDATMTANLGSAFATVKAAVAAMGRAGGSIVLVSSAAARLGLANHEAIAAAKAGVIGLTLSAAATYASRGIRVNCVAPGLVRTPMTARITANDAGVRSSEAMHALGRLGEPGDVAAAIAWLLGSRSGWVTGQVLGVDGGLATVRTRGKN